jgi:hypothetical protein
MKPVFQTARRVRAFGLLWLFTGAVLFLVGPSRSGGAKMKQVAKVGVGAAITASATIIAVFG